jgi:tetratricopeptide (TPR) repeat protein
VPLWLCCAILVLVLVLIATLFDAGVQLAKRAVRVSSARVTGTDTTEDGGQKRLLCVFQPSEAFVVNSIVSVFHQKNGVERLIGLGQIRSIQEDGKMQAVVAHELGGFTDVFGALHRRDQETVNSMLVKHFVADSRLWQMQAGGATTKVSSESLEATMASPEDESTSPEEETAGGRQAKKDNEGSNWIPILLEGDFERARTAFEEEQKASSKELSAKRREEAFFWGVSLGHGHLQAQTELERLKEDPHARAEASYFLGQAYRHAGKFDRAMEEFTLAKEASNSDEWPNKEAIAVAHAESQRLGGDRDGALAQLLTSLKEASDDKKRATVFKALAEHYEETGKPVLRSVALTAAREHDDVGSSVAFDVAYAWSHLERQSLAAYLYDLLLRGQPENATAWNNLGVCYDREECAIRSIQCYLRSAEQGETLAMANMAAKYLDAGFAKDAEQLLQKARESAKKLHENVGHKTSQIAKTRKQEAGRVESILARGRKEHLFFVGFANAYFLGPNEPPKAGIWQDENDVTYELASSGSEFILVYKPGSFERRAKGSFHGQGATFTMEEESYSFSTSKKTWKEEGKGFLFTDVSGDIQFMETKGGSTKLVRLHRAESAKSSESAP